MYVCMYVCMYVYVRMYECIGIGETVYVRGGVSPRSMAVTSCVAT